MPRFFVVFVVAAVAAGSLAPASRGQSPVSGADRAAIQALISGQIAAFQADDGTRAYSAASPAIQQLFPSAGEFMAMVAGQYLPVYRPRAVTFGTLAETPDGPVQQVFLVGPDGKSYVAEYLMEQEADGSFRIDGVSIIPNDQPSI